MLPLRIGFLWHQHQPNYVHPGKGIFVMPWVRMHALKDYYDLVAILDDFPSIHQNFNLVPSMLAQLEDYIKESRKDRIEILTVKRASDLTESDKTDILSSFFQANWPRLIEIYPGYRRLLKKRGRMFDSENPASALAHFTTQDFQDLQVWYNLCWTGELHKREEPFKGLIGKDHGFSEEDKQVLLNAQKEILKKIIIKHKEAQERGQIEISVSPFYHPILPLLCDTRIARQSQPEISLPKHRFRHPEDAREQVTRAIEFHEKRFGNTPSGMWPSEGSVSEEVADIFAQNNIRWIATDEEILFSSWSSLDWHHLAREDLYRPWRVETPSGSLAVFFRDHELSDLIGFVYQGWGPERAANNFISKLKHIRNSIIRKYGESRLSDSIVSVILDGENCWEFYPQNGLPFLESLYDRISDDPELKSVTFSEHLDSSDAPERLPKLFPGSWINHNFSIWIGHPEDNLAWDYVYEAKRALISAQKSGKYSKEILQSANEEILVAEGSDWCWWYGDEHTTVNSTEFDELFRSHLIRVYELLRVDVPSHFYEPIRKRGHRKVIISEPVGFISPTIDGMETNYFEWLGAGVFHTKHHGESMHQMAQFVECVMFGFDIDNFYVKVLTRHGNTQRESDQLEVVLNIVKPRHIKLRANLGSLRGKSPKSGFRIEENGRLEETTSGVQAAHKDFLEIGIPFRLIGGKSGDEMGFQIRVYQDEKLLEKWPKSDLIQLQIPDSEFERIEWKV
jgi:alpha-amylase/alpha-mannosidase (GH57 family)